MTDIVLATDADAPTKLDLDGLPDLLGFHLRLAHVAVYRDFSVSLVGLDLTQKQCATLQLIGANPGVSQVDLANTLGTDRATMMAMIDRLDQRGFVVRKRSTSDRRRQELNLTKAGGKMLTQARKAIDKHERHFTSLFTAAELGAFVEALSRIHKQV
jgi:DNA-binding MarR family transcriptional regulator